MPWLISSPLPIIVEKVQRGMSSRFYDSGRYSPKHEGGVHHFHGLIREFLGID
ncbi:MAG TPA: hypothetical protein EYN91_03850 [Candidatus Melainabacteria bacterium]|nr:hypothetical protein [Candidatus Melainabacteria bacterium]